MKYLDHLQVSDVELLTALAKNTGLGSYPLLAQHQADVEAAYDAYLAAANAGLAPSYHPVLPAELLAAMKSHYDSSRKEIEGFLHFTRHRLSPGVCPMCGAASSATIDHVYPKTPWPVYSFFSMNLVPACDQCNRKKRDNFFGTDAAARPIHPYFDNVLQTRVAVARLVPPYMAPIIEIVPAADVPAAFMPVIEWHLENVVRKTKITVALGERWHNICRDPRTFYEGLQFGATVEQAVRAKRASFDSQFETPNNWESILQSAIVDDPACRAYIAACYAAPAENPA